MHWISTIKRLFALNLLLVPLGFSVLPDIKTSAEPILVPDLNFPMIRLPIEYESHRSTKRIDLAEGQEYNLIDARGPGCIRHFWITTTVPDELEIEITCDGTEKPQIKMGMHRFFGVLLGKDPYRIESAPIKLLPKNGYNSYFPIPFQSSCRIVLRNTGKGKASVWSMVNWQQYDNKITLTPYRFHALFTEEKTAEALGTTLVGAISGKGFIAGMFHAILRKDYRDMIWHTGGDTWLFDGETNPHVMRGIGSEDVFGHSFGVYNDMSQWSGCPHAVGENADCSEVVAYRFFGPDPILFRSSLVLRFGTRANDVESVLYFYKEMESEAPKTDTPDTWTLSGPFDCITFDDFERTEFPEKPESQWPEEWNWGGRTLTPVRINPEHTWVDFTRWFRRDANGNTGTQPVKASAYAETVITSKTARKVILRFGFDDWMKIWLNDKPVSTLRHDNGFAVSEVPVTLDAGENRLCLKLSNFDNVEWRCWAFSCVIRNAK